MRVRAACFAAFFALVGWTLPSLAAPGCPAPSFAETVAGCSDLIKGRKLSGATLGTAYYNRGFALQSLGALKDAISDFSAAIKLNPKNAAAYNNRGYLLAMTGDLDGGVARH